MDFKSNKNVRQALATTARLLEERGCHVEIMTWETRNGKPKGLDDLVAGEDAVLKAFNEAKSVGCYLDEDKAKCTPPPEDVLGRVCCRRIQGSAALQ